MTIIKRLRSEIEQRNFRLFQNFFLFAIAGFVFLSFHRLALALAGSNQLNHVAWPDLGVVFFTGARFDLLVVGFFGIPLIVYSLISWSTGYFLNSRIRWLWVYLSIVWCAVGVIEVFDFIFFCYGYRHIQWLDFLSLLSGNTLFTDHHRTQSSSSFLKVSIMLLHVVVFWALIMWRILGSTFGGNAGALTFQEFDSSKKYNQSWAKRVFRQVGPALLLGLLARGTLTAHHLGLEHSEVTHSAFANELALNGIWTLDKNFRR